MCWRNAGTKLAKDKRHLRVTETCVFTKHLNWECLYKQVEICYIHNISAFNKCLYAIRILFTPGSSVVLFMDV